MIAQAVDLLAFAVIGAVSGALYFGRLWLTIRRLPRLNHAMLWLLAAPSPAWRSCWRHSCS